MVVALTTVLWLLEHLSDADYPFFRKTRGVKKNCGSWSLETLLYFMHFIVFFGGFRPFAVAHMSYHL